MTIVFKYISQTLKTLKILIRERPDVVLVMTPPVIACFAVWSYTRLARCVYAIDTHTAAFVHPRWRPLLFLHQFFSRRAVATIVTNQYLKSVVEGWGAHERLLVTSPFVLPNRAQWFSRVVAI